MAVSLKPLSLLPDGSFAIVVDGETYSVSRTLAAGVAKYINLPAGTKYVVFGSNGSFRVKYNEVQAGTAAAAFGDATPNTVCQEDNPTIRYLGNGLAVTELSVI